KVVVKLKFKNNATDPAKIAKALIGHGERPSQAFIKVSTRAGGDLPFLGAKPDQSKELMTLEPGKEVQGSFDISESFKWEAEPAEYFVRYDYPAELADSEIELKSKEVSLKF